MNRRGLGCLSGTGIIATLITAFSIAGYGFASGGVMFSPGALNAVRGAQLGGVASHAEIDGNCAACHVAPWATESMDDRCLVCHADIAADLSNLETIHGRLEQHDPEAACRDCHPEHNGSMASLTVIESWKFPHEVTGYWLTGHQFKAEDEPFLCADCHGNDVTRFDPKFCNECHSQKDAPFMEDHQSAFGSSCVNCHDGIDSYGNDFDHNLFHFALNGKHAALACAKCHVNSPTIIALQITKQDCFSCHGVDDPHQGGLGTDCASCHAVDGWKPAHFDHNRSVFKLTGGHAKVACANCHADLLFKGTSMDCFSCHQPDDPHQGLLGTKCEACHQPSAWTTVTFDHSTSAFPLSGMHATVECKSCHDDLLFKGTPKDCFACHAPEDAHQGQLGTDCARCHTSNGWTPSHFDHDLAAFRLTGAHTDVACESCHVNGVYRGIPKNCFGCHASRDAHNGQFGTDCASCHVTSGWQNVTFDHNTTAFPLTGSHANAVCSACHTNGVFNGTPTNCFACHATRDAHGGQFGTDCGACHQTTRWQDVTFDHNNTAFPLSGRHANVNCSACHQNGVYRGTPTNCFACHANRDAHNGQFGTNCGTCHNPGGWGNATFDHNNTAFPLVGRHTDVNCTSCHSNGVFQGTPSQCFACHANDDAHNGENGTDCGSCHTPRRWGD